MCLSHRLRRLSSIRLTRSEREEKKKSFWIKNNKRVHLHLSRFCLYFDSLFYLILLFISLVLFRLLFFPMKCRAALDVVFILNRPRRECILRLFSLLNFIEIVKANRLCAFKHSFHLLLFFHSCTPKQQNEKCEKKITFAVKRKTILCRNGKKVTVARFNCRIEFIVSFYECEDETWAVEQFRTQWINNEGKQRTQ